MFPKTIAACLWVCIAFCVPAYGGNSVVIESKTVAPGATDVSLGVYVENNDYLLALVLPLEIREIDPGSYIANSLDFDTVSSGRVGQSGLMDFWGCQYSDSFSQTFDCSGPLSHTFAPGSPTPPESFFTNPSGIFWHGVNAFGPCLEPGSDGSPGNGNPSFRITFDVTSTPGAFEIDTCCFAPLNSLAFVATSGGAVICDFANYLEQIPSFTKGIVTISSGCHCDCHADPECDGVTNIVDAVIIVDVAFRGGSPRPDPNPACPFEMTDVNCDGKTDILDVVTLIAVGFRGGNPAELFCDPCP